MQKFVFSVFLDFDKMDHGQWDSFEPPLDSGDTSIPDDHDYCSNVIDSPQTNLTLDTNPYSELDSSSHPNVDSLAGNV